MKCWSLVLLGLVATRSLGRRDNLRHSTIIARRSRASSSNDQATEFSLTRTAGSGYYTVAAALNGSTVHLVVDTASPWLWSYGTGSHTGDDDETMQAEPPTFNIDYLSARLSGLVVSKTLSFTHSAAEQQTVQSEDALLQQSSSGMGSQCWVGQATAGDSFWIRQWKTSNIQGVLGLACGANDATQPSNDRNPGQPSLQTALGCAVAATGDTDLTFSLQLHEEGGTLTFGAVPESLLAGLVTMPPSLFCGNWRIPVRVSLGTKSGSNEKSQAEAVLDSAAVGIIGPEEQVASLASKLGTSIEVRSGRMVFALPCNATDSIPSLVFNVGAVGQMAQVELGGSALVTPDRDSAAGNCRLALAAWDSPQWLLGGPFLRQIRGLVFDAGTRSVSIAP